MEFGEIIFYVIVFLALYVQVFLFITFISKRRELFHSEKKLPKLYPSIGVIVPCWNEEGSVERTILSLLNLNYPKDKLHIYVVDDGSTDDTWTAMQKFENFSQVNIYRKENGGKHTALNFALEKIETDLVSSIDADTILERDALLTVINFLEEKLEEKKDISAVGCTVLIGNPKTLTEKAQSIEYQMFAFSKKMLGLIGGVLVAPGAFSVFKREALKSVGGWMAGHSLEDLELTFRLQKNGFKADHCHGAIAHTKAPNSIKKLFTQRLRWGYGFLKNIQDYRDFIFNKKLGNLGFFTIPMSIIAYITLVFVFIYSWQRMAFYAYDKIAAFRLVGWDSLLAGGIRLDWFFINTEAISFISILLFFSILMSIFLGRKISGAKGGWHNIIWYFLIYSFTQPIWIMKSIYKYLFAKKVLWR